MKNIFIILICIVPIALQGQRDAAWLLGAGTYPMGGPIPDSCCAFEMRFVADTIQTNWAFRNPEASVSYELIGNVFNAGGASYASICNIQGTLILQSNAKGVYNSQGYVIEGGGSLPMDTSIFAYNSAPLSYRSIYFLPNPNGSNSYYLIHPYQTYSIFDYLGTVMDDIYHTQLLVSKIDMDANDGKGRVLPYEVILQDTIMLTSVSVTHHANGRDWWIVAPRHNSNGYYKFLIDATGVHPYPIQTIGSVNEYDAHSSRGAYFSQDGSMLVVEDPRYYRFLDFDRCTGMLSNPSAILGLDYGCPKNPFMLYLHYTALSPNNRFLYVNDFTWAGSSCMGDSIQNNRLYQYDLQSPTDPPIVVIQSDATLTTNGSGIVGAPFLTPNGIMVLNYSYSDSNTTFNMIKKPNLKGLACEPLRIPFGKYLGGSVWNMSVLPNYSLGPLVGSPCDTITSVSIGTTGVSPLQVYPNPTQDMLHVHCPYTDATLTLYNALGIEVYRSRITGQDAEVSLAGLGKGVYFLVVKTEDNRIFTEKVRKE